MPATRIFSERLERIYLFVILPLIFVIWLAVLFGFMRPLSIKNKLDFIFLKYVALNFTHVLMSLIIVFVTPEGRAWLKGEFKTRNGLWFVAVSCLIFLGAVLKISDPTPAQIIYIKLISVFLFSIHTVQQTKGLALLYNRNAEVSLSDEKKDRFHRLEKVERILFEILVKAVFVYFLLTTLPIDIDFDFTRLFAFIFAAAVVGIIAVVFMQARIQRSNKSWFISTLLFVPAIPLSTTADLLYRSLHGIEFGFLTHGMWKRSRVGQFTVLLGAMVTALIVFSIGGMFQRHVLPAQYVGRGGIRGLILFNFFIEHLHYYLDSRMFRLRDPSVKKHIGPLVSSEREIRLSQRPSSESNTRENPGRKNLVVEERQRHYEAIP